MTLGPHTIGFVTVTESGDPGYLGLKTETRTVVLVSGGLMQPASVQERQALGTDVSTELWTWTGPAETAALAADSTGEILFDGTATPADVAGNRFQIEGPVMPESDFTGVNHVVVMCRRQHG